MFRVIFVLDILKGNVVHAIRGERHRYQPVKGSKVCDSSAPLDIIAALNPSEVYIADLDRLQHIGNNFELIRKISAKTRTMVDTGTENISDVENCAGIADTVIIGTETASLELIKQAVKKFPGRINVSIDLKNGEVLTKDSSMLIKPAQLVKLLNGCDIRDIIILELSKVGTGAGINAEFLREIAGMSTHSVLAGGGIRDMRDIDMLKEIGVSGALVATALHNGSISPDVIR